MALVLIQWLPVRIRTNFTSIYFILCHIIYKEDITTKPGCVQCLCWTFVSVKPEKYVTIKLNISW